MKRYTQTSIILAILAIISLWLCGCNAQKNISQETQADNTSVPKVENVPENTTENSDSEDIEIPAPSIETQDEDWKNSDSDLLADPQNNLKNAPDSEYPIFPELLSNVTCSRNYSDLEKSIALKESSVDSTRQILNQKDPKMNDLKDAWIAGNNRLGLKVLPLFDDNVAFSPLSLERAMGMVIDGACANSYDELTLGMEMPKLSVLSQLGKWVMNDITKNLQSVEFVSDNRLWVQKDFELRQGYVDTIEGNYGAAPAYLDFKNHPEEAVNQVNSSIEKATRGHIKELFDKFSEDTRMVLTNAMYFKSNWRNGYQFDESMTDKQLFYSHDEHFLVDMMHKNDFIQDNVYIDDAWVAVSIPFEDNFNYMAVLPILKKGETAEAALRRVEQLFYKEYDRIMSNYTDKIFVGNYNEILCNPNSFPIKHHRNANPK